MAEDTQSADTTARRADSSPDQSTSIPGLAFSRRALLTAATMLGIGSMSNAGAADEDTETDTAERRGTAEQQDPPWAPDEHDHSGHHGVSARLGEAAPVESIRTKQLEVENEFLGFRQPFEYLIYKTTVEEGEDEVVALDGKTNSIADHGPTASEIIQTAVDELPAQGRRSGTGRIVFAPGRYRIDNPIEIPRNDDHHNGPGGYGDVIFDAHANRGKGFVVSGGVIFEASPELEGEPLVRTQTAPPEGGDPKERPLSAFGITFKGLKFHGQSHAAPLVDLPDTDTVRFSNCNFKDSAGDNLRMFASENLGVDYWGLPGKLEVVGCEFAEAGRDHIRVVDTTQNKFAGNMFNPVTRNHLYIESSNKQRIYGNEFNRANQGEYDPGETAHIWVVGTKDRPTHEVVATNNVFIGEPGQDGFHEEDTEEDRDEDEDEANVRRNIIVGNTVAEIHREVVWTESNSKTQHALNGQEEDVSVSDFQIEKHNPTITLRDANGEEFRLVKRDDAEGTTANIYADSAVSYWLNNGEEVQRVANIQPNGDLSLEEPGKGLILTAPNGDTYRLYVTNTGEVDTHQIS